MVDHIRALMGLSAADVFHGRNKDPHEVLHRVDPSWNYLPRVLILNALPLFLLGDCLSSHPILDAAFLPLVVCAGAIGVGLRLGGDRSPLQFRDCLNRRYFPTLLPFLLATLWLITEPMLDDAAQVCVFALELCVLGGILGYFGVVQSPHFYRSGVLPGIAVVLTVSLLFAVAFLVVTRASQQSWAVGMAAAVIAAAPFLSIIWIYVRRQPVVQLEGIRKVGVVGAGWAGVYALKWLKENGLGATGHG